ncbi:FAD-dependent oxidoreductase [Acidobacteriota bacterium]
MPKKSIAIVGGGIAGLTIALEFAKTGKFRVTIFEKENQIGGLNSYYKQKDIVFDKFYHVILPADVQMRKFIDELGLKDQIYWRSIKSGFFGKGKLVSMSSLLDFARFPFLSPLNKIRLGLGILYNSRIKKPQKLDEIYAKEWLSRNFGKSVFKSLWLPLLRSKLGDSYKTTSAAFIWAIIDRLYGARKSSNKQEKMGYVEGGAYNILNAAEIKLRNMHVEIKTNACVHKVEATLAGRKPGIHVNSHKYEFDKVVLTIPCPEIIRIVNIVESDPYWSTISEVGYLRLICVLLILSRKLSHYYVINLLDEEMPFTGIIESTNILTPQELGEKHLVYLPKYFSFGDPIAELADDEIKKLFIKKLKNIFPSLKDEEILHTVLFKEKHVQPIRPVRFLHNKVGFRTPLENVYLANSYLVFDSTSNNNATIGLASSIAQQIINEDQ